MLCYMDLFSDSVHVNFSHVHAQKRLLASLNEVIQSRIVSLQYIAH